MPLEILSETFIILYIFFQICVVCRQRNKFEIFQTLNDPIKRIIKFVK